MTIDERIAAELRSYVPHVDEHVAWDTIQSAAIAPRRRWQAPILATASAAALAVFVVGLIVLSSGVPPAGDVTPAAQLDVVHQTVAAANSQDVGSLRRLFAEDAEVDVGAQWGAVPLTEPDFVGAWMGNLEVWDFDGLVTGCGPFAAGSVDCEVRARWHTLSAEAVEEWSFVFDGDLIRTLTIRRVDLNPEGRILPLGLEELDDWEDWLEISDPAAARRLIPDAGTSRLFALFLRYDGGLADEIEESIQQYLNEPPRSDEFLDGEVTFGGALGWVYSFAGWDFTPTMETLLHSGEYAERVALVADALPVERGCEVGPAPANAEALAQTIRTDPDLEVSEPVAVIVGGIEGMRMDVVAAPGASNCDYEGAMPAVLAATTGTIDEGHQLVEMPVGSRMRLYLLDLPEEMSARILAIAIAAPESRFDQVVEAAAPIVDSVEFHTR